MWSELPTEVLLHIFSFLEPLFLLRSVSNVCMRFRNILFDRNNSRLNYYQLLLRCCPEVEDVPFVRHMSQTGLADLKQLGDHLGKAWKRWQEPVPHGFRASLGTVDAVHILKGSSICLVGHREKSIDLWEVSGLPAVKGMVPAAHLGWVTCLDSHERHSFVSGGWDYFACLWNIRESWCQRIRSLNCRSAVMSVASRADVVAIAAFDPVLLLLDPRDWQIRRYKVHLKSLVDIAISGHHIISVSRDQALNVFDLRMMRTVVRRNRYAGTAKGGVPRCLAVHNNIVYVGDNRGFVHLLDSNTDLKAFHSIPVASSKTKITAICPDLGTFLCGGSDGVLRAVVPSKPNFVINKIGAASSPEITCMSYENDILAVSRISGVVEAYNPSSPSRV